MAETRTQPAAADIAVLRAAMAGTVSQRGDPDYDRARSVWNGNIDRHPAMVARCHSPTDVAAAVQHAQRTGLEVAVRGGGHGYWGAAVPEGGLMINLRALNQVTVDPVARRARCGGGAMLAELDAATQEYGLAVTGGMVSHTGVGGLTLGGGMGWLTRMCGLSIDNLTAAQVVLADGRIVRASPDEHADLFWALRGGGGNFGVVTEFEFALHPVGPLVHLGMVFWELDRAAAALRAARDVVEVLPREVGANVVALNAPPAPFVPEQHHFVPGIALVLAGFGSAQEHAAQVASARAALPPLFEFTSEIPYTALQQLLDDAVPWGVHGYSKALYLDTLSDEAIALLAERLPAKASPMTLVPILPLGGAFADVGEHDTAFGGSRSTRFVVGMDAIAPDEQTLAAERDWVRSLWDALRPLAADGGGYVNFMAEYDEDRVRAAYGTAKYDRLARIKAEYDPGNLFHLNANIKPS